MLYLRNMSSLVETKGTFIKKWNEMIFASTSSESKTNNNSLQENKWRDNMAKPLTNNG